MAFSLASCADIPFHRLAIAPIDTHDGQAQKSAP